MTVTLVSRTGVVAQAEFAALPPAGYIVTLGPRRRYVVVGGAFDAEGGVELAVMPLPEQDISTFALILYAAPEHVRWASERAFGRTMEARAVREGLEAWEASY